MRKKIKKVLDKSECLVTAVVMASAIYILVMKRMWRQRNDK